MPTAFEAAEGYGTLDGPSQTLPALYTLPNSDFHDITSGNISPSGNLGYSATTGYDLSTGLGTPSGEYRCFPIWRTIRQRPNLRPWPCWGLRG